MSLVNPQNVSMRITGGGTRDLDMRFLEIIINPETQIVSAIKDNEWSSRLHFRQFFKRRILFSASAFKQNVVVRYYKLVKAFLQARESVFLILFIYCRCF